MALAISCASISFADDARVLPKGRSRFGFTYGHTAKISHTYNEHGHSESLTEPYNLSLSSATLTSFNPEFAKLVDVLNATGWRYNEAEAGTSSYGLTRDSRFPALGDALSRGYLNVDAEARRQQYGVSFMHGVTDSLSAGFILPIIRNKVGVRYGVHGKNSAQDIYENWESHDAGELAQVIYHLNMLKGASPEMLQEYISSRGYDRFEDSDSTAIGDLIAGGRFSYLQQGPWIASTQLMLSIPTGKLRSPRQITGVDFGTGSWDLGSAHLTNYRPIRQFTLEHGLYYTYRFAHNRTLRVRKDPYDFLPDESSEHSVRVKYGDKVWTTLVGNFHLNDAFTLMSGYEWFWWSKNQYQGGMTDRDYSYLSEQSNGYLETFTVGATVSSISSFLQGEFAAPVELKVNLFLPVRGRNAIIAPFGTAEISLYF